MYNNSEKLSARVNNVYFLTHTPTPVRMAPRFGSLDSKNLPIKDDKDMMSKK